MFKKSISKILFPFAQESQVELDLMKNPLLMVPGDVFFIIYLIFLSIFKNRQLRDKLFPGVNRLFDLQDKVVPI